MTDNEDCESRLEAAARWHTALQDPGVTLETLDAFSAWEADPENAEAFRITESVLSAVDQSLATIGPVERNQAKPGKAKHLIVWAIAALAGILALPTLVMIRPLEGGGTPPETYRTSIGEQKRIDLEDGSVMILNTASVAEVSYSKARRLVFLETGEALFDVEKDGRPFLVDAGGSRTTALGTAFSVQTRDELVSVVLVEGSVSVSELGPQRRMFGLFPASREEEERTVLEPGQRLVMTSGHASQVETVNTAAALAWQTGILQFDDMRLDEVIDELNRYSETKLVLGDPALGEERISGGFPVGQQEAFGRNLTYLLPVRIEQTGREIRILPGTNATAP
nr:FecR domain-containing protein [uncultured Hyphomonas sp.]